MGPKLSSIFTGVAAFALVGGVGCASVPRPENELTDSAASVKAADELGARAVPAAALEYQLARDEFQQAQDHLAKQENEEAKLALWRSKADAELAIAMVRQSRARADERTAEEKLHSLETQTPGTAR